MHDSNRHAHSLSLPPLPTLHHRPSWTNRAGRVDRSACLALSVARLWRRIEPDGWKKLCSGDPAREAWAEIAVHAIDLLTLHRRRVPHTLRGDLRTTKSNAMRHLLLPLGEGRGECESHLPSPSGRGAGGEGASESHGATSSQLQRPPRTRVHKRTAAPNPNHGATSTKVLGLTRDDGPFDDVHDWVQVIRMERWRYPLPPPTREQINRLSFRAEARATLPRAQHFFICPSCGGKFRKLFTILATRDELRDARLAEGWIAMLEARQRAARRTLDPRIIALRARLIERYGLLFRGFRGRRLLCRTCLGIRYGEVKPGCIESRTADLHRPLWFQWTAQRRPSPPDPRVEGFWERLERVLAAQEAEHR